MSKNIESSYKKNNFDDIFKKICKQVNPKSILEIGILDGYSLKAFANHSSKDSNIVAIDLFEDYEYKNSNFKFVENLFSQYKNVDIKYGNFYEYHKTCDNFDIIHIDISNDAGIFQYALNHYFPKTNKLLILEGGSKERDNVEWMTKFNKPSIDNFLKNLDREYKFNVIELFPSLTIFYKNFYKDLEIIWENYYF